MNLVPEKLFVNLYAPAVGPCVGAAYPTKEAADRHANSHRLLCLELGARPANTIAVSDHLFNLLTAVAKERDCDIAAVIESVVEIHTAVPPEIRALLRRYALENRIKYATAVAECCRAYLTEAAR